MKPTNKQIISALNKLMQESKTELKSEKVELGLGDDVEKARKKVEQVIKESAESVKESKNLLSILGSVDGAVATMKIHERTANKVVVELGDIVSKMEKALKELGINPSSQKSIASANKFYSEGLKVRKQLEDARMKIVSKASQIK